ncbi:hypothetical protein PORY_001431 [Pneumocystis oryctolagi]|uniref:Uncharacterized protein n=1 Tax=Pneumocystis oryctolagi TaxID=42067 RepID=A0ACB7CCI4_9ASCO|nr:hypothetical protein PORY_001431 [Pneumocystis oryctolagi]
MAVVLESDIEVLKRSLTCEICTELLASPFMLSCGHAFCYGCILDWLFHKRTCPTCRQTLSQRPALAYLVQEMVEVFVRRIEAQDPKGEGCAARKHQLEQRQRMENNKENLFYDFFLETPAFTGVLCDREDGVMRCMQCHWEIEGPICTHCGFRFSDENLNSFEDVSHSGQVTSESQGTGCDFKGFILSEADDYDYDDPFIDDRRTDEIERDVFDSEDNCSKDISEQAFSTSCSDTIDDNGFDRTDQDSFIQEHKRREKINEKRSNVSNSCIKKSGSPPILIESDENINIHENVSAFPDSGSVSISSSSIKKNSNKYLISILSDSPQGNRDSGLINSDYDNISTRLSDDNIIMPLQTNKTLKKTSNKLKKRRRMFSIPSSTDYNFLLKIMEHMDSYINDNKQSSHFLNEQNNINHTLKPILTGTSVLGLKFKDGVMLAADNLASYGSLARFDDVERLFPVGMTVVGVSGEISDFQYLKRLLESFMIKEKNYEDGHTLCASHIYEYLSQVFYNRRTKMNPLLNSCVVGGLNPENVSICVPGANCDRPGIFLGYVDFLGVTYSAPCIATGYGAYMAIPLLRKATEDGRDALLSQEDARKVIDDCMRVLYCRDARSLNKFSVATITKDGITFDTNQSVDTRWNFAEKIEGYGY